MSAPDRPGTRAGRRPRPAGDLRHRARPSTSSTCACPPGGVGRPRRAATGPASRPRSVLGGVLPPTRRRGRRRRRRRRTRPARGPRGRRLLPRRRRAHPPRHPVGAPAARRPAAADGRRLGARARATCSSASTSPAPPTASPPGFSHGMGRRLSVLLAAFHEPPVLLLDEPFDGVDPLGVEATLEEVRRARLRGAAVLVSTHLLELAVQACDEAVVLRAGRVVSASPAAELAGDGGRRALPRAAVVSGRRSGRRAAARCAGGWCARGACRSSSASPPSARSASSCSPSLAGSPPRWAARPAPTSAPRDLLGSNVDRTGEIAVLIPSAMLAFILLCIIAPIVAGGGTELIPESQLVAYPVKVRTLVRLVARARPAQRHVVPAGAAARRGDGVRRSAVQAAPGCRSVVLLSFLAACTTVGPQRRLAARRPAPHPARSRRRPGRCSRVLRRRRAVGHRHRPGRRPARRVAHRAGARRAAAAPPGSSTRRLPLVVRGPARRGRARVRRRGAPPRRGRCVAPATSAPTAPLSRRCPGAPRDRDDLGHAARHRPRVGLALAAAAPRAARARRAAGDRRGASPACPGRRSRCCPRWSSSGAALLFGVNALSLDGSGAVWVSTLPARPAARAARQGPGRRRGDRRRGDARAGRRRPCARAAGPTSLDVVCAVGASVGLHRRRGRHLHAPVGHASAPRRAARPARHPGAAREHGPVLRAPGRP